MEVRNHLPHARNTSWHGADHVVLVAVVDSHVRIRGPDQHRIDSAVSLFQIIEITIHRVAVRDRIVEITVFDHHLRLKKAGLRPLECRQVVARAVVADANPAFIAPMPNVGQPGIMLILSARRGSTFPRAFHLEAFRAGYLLPVGIPGRPSPRDKCSVLGPKRCDREEPQRYKGYRTESHLKPPGRNGQPSRTDGI